MGDVEAVRVEFIHHDEDGAELLVPELNDEDAAELVRILRGTAGRWGTRRDVLGVEDDVAFAYAVGVHWVAIAHDGEERWISDWGGGALSCTEFGWVQLNDADTAELEAIIQRYWQ